MIVIEDKHKCCGCSACQQICPRDCISLKFDREGFAYPEVDMNACIQCGLCEETCPELNRRDAKRPMETFAAIVNDEDVRAASSSGGIFSAIAEKMVGEGGRVYGARFNKDLDVEHGCADTLDGIADFRGSKYVQSFMNDTYKEIRSDLRQGRKVLFTGTPCQVAGLRNFLKKDYENLTAVDVVCHGVPSAAVWQSYLASFRKVSLRSANFRDKSQGWHNFGLKLEGSATPLSVDWQHFASFRNDPYMQIYRGNLSLRPSCFNCPAKGGRSGSDLTLADFWGIEAIDPEIDDNKGTSLILVNSQKGKKILNGLNVILKPEPYDKALEFNPCIEDSVREPVLRHKFFREFSRSGFSKTYKIINSPSLVYRTLVRLGSVVTGLFKGTDKSIADSPSDK